jgi:hypothetical protein
MAELALGIVGLALAWKGVMDFAELIGKLMEDDAWTQEGLALRLRVSNEVLGQWGEYWEITKGNGRFQTLPTTTRQLIADIIFRLRDSRATAQTRLSLYYGIATDKEGTSNDDSRNKTSKLLDRIKSVSKSVKNKTVWLTSDRELVTRLVEETMTLYEQLQQLTFMSPKFLMSILPILHSTAAAGIDIRGIGTKVEEPSQDLYRKASQSTSIKQSEFSMDMQTRASFEAKSIASSIQADRVRQLIEQAYFREGDGRITDAIGEWWGDHHSGILVIEGQDMSEDVTDTFVLLYSLVTCPKLIYSLDPESKKDRLERFVDMLRILVQGLVCLGTDDMFSGIPYTFNTAEADSPDMKAVQRYVDFLLSLLDRYTSCCDKPVLLVIDRMDLVIPDWDNELSELVRHLVSGLQKLCNEISSRPSVSMKVLLGYNPCARIVPKCVSNPRHVVDLTDHNEDTVNLRIELLKYGILMKNP